MKKLIIIILSILLALFAYNTILLFPHRMKYVEYNNAGVYINCVQPDKSKQEYKKQIEQLINTPHIYLKTKFASRVFVPTRTVHINENVSIDEYVKSLAHELVHIKYQTRNERFVTYTTIITLYEAGDTYLKYIALDYANEVWGGKFTKTRYDCGYQLAEYFKEKA